MEIGMDDIVWFSFPLTLFFYTYIDSSVVGPLFSPKKFKVLVRAKCVCLVCFLVTSILFVGGASSELAYSNGHKNREEVVQFLLNRKPKILLQWTPHISQKIKLVVRGCCSKASGDYKWLSSDMRVLVVSSNGLIQAKRPGIAIVKAVSTCDPHNFDEIVVKVLPSHDVCYDMGDMDPKLDNDLSEPICEPIACLYMICVISFLATIIFLIVNHYSFRHICIVMPVSRCSKTLPKRLSMRRTSRKRL